MIAPGAAGLDTTNAPSKYLNTLSFTPEAELRKAEDQRIIESRPAPEPVIGLVSHIRGVFERHKQGRLDIEQKMLRTIRRIAREYEADILAAIKEIDDPETFTGHSAQKVEDAEAWIIDVLNPEVDRTWDIEPSPIADIPPDIQNAIRENVQMQIVEEVLMDAQMTGEMPPPEEIMQIFQARSEKIEEEVKKEAQNIAEERSANMERKISDQLVEGGWVRAFKAIISDLCKYKLCCLKGPIFRRKKVLKWEEDIGSGEYAPQVKDQIIPEFVRVAPFDWYPAPDSIQSGDGDEIEIEHVNRSDFQKLIGVPGYKADIIRKIMTEFPNGYREMTVIEAERFLLEKQNTIGITNIRKYDVVNFWGSVPGELLLQWGMEKEKIPDPTLDYEVNAKIVANYCIKAVINPDPLNRHPYRTTSYRKSNDSQWGECPGDMMESLQDQLNASSRALSKNIAWASAPITELDRDRCDIPGEVLEVWPGKTIVSTNQQMNSGPAVKVYDIPIKTEAILRVIEKLERIADDTVVPSYGSANKGGASGKTAAGLSMLRTDSARKLKLAILNVSMDIVIPAIDQLFSYNMRFLNDPSIKGDCNIKPRGIASVIAKEQMSVRRNEYLGLAVGNPVLQSIHGMKGLTFMVAETVKSLDMNVDKAIPNREEIDKQGANRQPMSPMQPQQASPPGAKTLDVAGNENNSPKMLEGK